MEFGDGVARGRTDRIGNRDQPDQGLVAADMDHGPATALQPVRLRLQWFDRHARCGHQQTVAKHHPRAIDNAGRTPSVDVAESFRLHGDRRSALEDRLRQRMFRVGFIICEASDATSHNASYVKLRMMPSPPDVSAPPFWRRDPLNAVVAL